MRDSNQRRAAPGAAIAAMAAACMLVLFGTGCSGARLADPLARGTLPVSGSASDDLGASTLPPPVVRRATGAARAAAPTPVRPDGRRGRAALLVDAGAGGRADDLGIPVRGARGRHADAAAAAEHRGRPGRAGRPVHGTDDRLQHVRRSARGGRPALPAMLDGLRPAVRERDLVVARTPRGRLAPLRGHRHAGVLLVLGRGPRSHPLRLLGLRPLLPHVRREVRPRGLPRRHHAGRRPHAPRRRQADLGDARSRSSSFYFWTGLGAGYYFTSDYVEDSDGFEVFGELGLGYVFNQTFRVRVGPERPRRGHGHGPEERRGRRERPVALAAGARGRAGGELLVREAETARAFSRIDIGCRA